MSTLANVTMSCKQVSDSDVGVMPPFVIACGHQRIIVPKTGNTFPALCVCVPDTNHSCSLVWRSKRDFLLLARSTNNIQFPKAAFQRLTEENVVPWIRRPVEEVFQGSGQTDCEKARREAIQQIDSFHESCFSLPNKYQVKMKKSVWQLDTFLQSTAKQVGRVSSSAHKNAAAAGWATFCRPEDTEGLVSCSSRSSNVVNDDTDVQDRHQSITSPTLQESSRLGQYFASPENSQEVADAAMKFACFNLIDHNSTLPFRYLFVEPSCGHGDILVELLKRLQHHRISPEIVTIVGYDIDPHAIAICQQRKEFLESSYKCCFHWRHGNFLESRKEVFPVGGNRSRLATICLGGPPYTTGAGSSNDIQRNLPILFVQHCQEEWEADCIAFLLPERYRLSSTVSIKFRKLKTVKKPILGIGFLTSESRMPVTKKIPINRMTCGHHQKNNRADDSQFVHHQWESKFNNDNVVETAIFSILARSATMRQDPFLVVTASLASWQCTFTSPLGCSGWNIASTSQRFHHIYKFSLKRPSVFSLLATVEKNPNERSIESSPTDSNDVLSGVAEFERWFAAIPGANRESSIQHDDFGNLRGLTCDSKALSSTKVWMTIPRSVVLQSDFSESDWDAKLSQELWKELQKGPSASTLSGYLALLTQGSSSWRDGGDNVPQSTAPDALRHWSTEEKALLSKSTSGKRLLDLENQQNGIWKSKFDNLNNNTNLTWEQFVWAMEVVHSRAFCGDFGIGAGSSVSTAVTVAAPLVAGIAGFAYYVPFHGQNDAVLLALAAVAAVPSLLNVVKQSTPVAVLLPLIDSANHLEEADSSIEYSSLNDSFTLGGGHKCVVKESSGKPQLYISYGKKKDTELLLNYGFLRGVPSDGDSSTRRRNLAEKFLCNNP